AALVEWNTPPRIFVQSGRLVTIIQDEEGRPTIKELCVTRLQGFMSDSADYVHTYVTDKSVSEVPVFPPLDLVKGILHGYNPQEYPFPPLEGVTEIPILRDDGSIYQTPGYDPISKYVYLPGNLVIPPVPDLPSLEQLESACKLLTDEWL